MTELDAVKPASLQERHPGLRNVAGAGVLDGLLPSLMIAAAFLGCAALSWRRLGSLIVDGGHELEVPRRLLAGAALYRDLSWNWGPLAPWLDTGLYRLFGVHSDTLMAAGLGTAALAALGLYLLARRFVGAFTSSWVAVAFLAGCAFSRRGDIAIFNFVAPFNFSATYGITLAIWSALLLVRHARSGDPWTLAVAAAHGAFLLTVLPHPGRARLIAWGGGIAVAALGFGVAAWTSQGRIWSSLFELLNGGSRFYVAESMGIRDPRRALVEVAISLLAWAVVLTMAWWAAGPRSRWFRALAWGALLAVPAFLLERTFFRAAPLLLAAGVAWIVLARMHEGEGALEGRWREHLIVWAFALGALPRIVLRTGVDHYGFYLVPPALVCVAIGMVHLLAHSHGPARSRRALELGASAVLAGVALGALGVSYRYLTRPVTEIRTARGHWLVNAGGPEATFVPLLGSMPPSTVGAAVPEGAGIVFASGLTPVDDGQMAYLPMVLEEPGAERRIVEAWERRPPGVIVHWTEDQSAVFGYTGFGKDYGLVLAHWISERYTAVRRSPDGKAELFVRRPRGRGGTDARSDPSEPRETGQQRN